MIIRGSVGKKNAFQRMGCLKPNEGYASRTDLRRDIAAIVSLFQELASKKTRAEVNKAPRKHGRRPGKYRAPFE